MRYVLAIAFGLMIWGVLGPLYKPVFAEVGLCLMWLAAKKTVGEFAPISITEAGAMRLSSCTASVLLGPA